MQPVRRSTAYLKSEFIWEDLVPKGVAKGLMKQGILSPTRIQSKAISASFNLNNRISIFQSQNGSGKTLAYLIPVFLRINKIGPIEYKKSDKHFTPQAMIFVHSQEIGSQILSAAKPLQEIFPSMKIGLLTQQDRDKGLPKKHILIGTPRMLDWGVRNKIILTHKLQILVIDEAEFVLNYSRGADSFCDIIQRMALPDRQMFFFSADFTKQSIELIYSLNRPKDKIYESLLPGILKMPLGISHYYIVNRGESVIDKALRMYNTGQVLIFVNGRNSAQGLAERLWQKYHNVEFFVGGEQEAPNEVQLSEFERNTVISAFDKNETRILVTTDALARGFDFRRVGLVINFHLPITHEKENPMNLDVGLYLHRAGRTGRFGDPGIVLNVLTDPKEKENIQRIEDGYSIKITGLDSSLDALRSVLKSNLNYDEFMSVISMN